MHAVIVVFAVLLIANAFCSVALIGRERKPISRLDAAIGVATAMVFLFFAALYW